MNYEILESLESVGYEGVLLDENEFFEAIGEGFSNEKLRSLVIWLSNEISELSRMEEKLTKDSDIGDFMIELSGFLRELQCYEILLNDSNINDRMQTVESRYLLLDYLISDLMTQKMLAVRKPEVGKVLGNVITIHETATAAALKDLVVTLNLKKPPDNITAKDLLQKISTGIDETLKSLPDADKRIGKPLFNPKKQLNEVQWQQIAAIQTALEAEYNLRRQMLLTRLDVTIQSFKWSDKIKDKEKDINERYSNKSLELEKLKYGNQRTDIASLLAARDKLAIMEKTSSANVRKNTQSKLQRHIIGKVPDRGGRTLENQMPPKEMPSWQKRVPGSSDNRGGRGRGRGRGNFDQNRGNQQGFPQQQFQQQPSHNPANQHYSGDNQQDYQGGFSGRGGRGGGRVQGGWNQNDNYRGGRGRR